MKEEEQATERRHWTKRHAAGHHGKSYVCSNVLPLDGDIYALKNVKKINMRNVSLTIKTAGTELYITQRTP